MKSKKWRFDMNRLKELTYEIHKKAERSAYAGKLLKGLPPTEYYKYLVNQYELYLVLEYYAENIIEKFPEIKRADRILQDIQELENEYGLKRSQDLLCDVVQDYRTHVSKLDENGLLAHIYVRHFGDMYGGQAIKKTNSGSGKMYEFENVDKIKTEIRPLLNDSMIDEANECFNFAIRLFEELDNKYYME